jgi:actin-related protein
MVFRDDNVIVIEIGSLTTRAVVGLAESMTPPQVRVPTKVGVKRKRNSPFKESPSKIQAEYLFGEELEEAIERKDPELEVIRPLVQGVIADWDAMEGFWYLHPDTNCPNSGDGYCLLDLTGNILPPRIMLFHLLCWLHRIVSLNQIKNV